MAKMYINIGPMGSAQRDGAGTAYPVKTHDGNWYCIYVESNSLDVVYRKSTDGGITWGTAVTIGTVSATALAVWYDRWSGISAGLIHCAYTDSTSDDTFYRSINTESSDSLSSQTTIFAGSTTASGGALSITRARGGNLYCKTTIDAGAEGGFFRSTDTGATWGSRTNTEALATSDQWILVPGFAADNQDIMCIFLDNSAGEISRYVNDDSANSWAKTSIDAGLVPVAATTNFPHFAATVDLTNSQILLVFWDTIDTAGQIMYGYTVTESAITAFGTNPVASATDDCGFAGIAIDTDTEDWYVYYGGNTDGSETWSSAINLYYKVSTDGGATWGSQTRLTQSTETGPSVWSISYMGVCPRYDTKGAVFWMPSTAAYILTIDEPAASSSSIDVTTVTANISAHRQIVGY